MQQVTLLAAVIVFCGGLPPETLSAGLRTAVNEAPARYTPTPMTNLFEDFLQQRRFMGTDRTETESPPARSPVPAHRRRQWHAHVTHGGRSSQRSLEPPLDAYNVQIPSPYDSAYDRVMRDHFRASVVSGFHDPARAGPIWPGIVAYRAQAADRAVLQYDGLTGRYITLARDDGKRWR